MSLPEMLTHHPRPCPALQAHNVARADRLPDGDGRRDRWCWLSDAPERNQRFVHCADDYRQVSRRDMILFYVAAERCGLPMAVSLPRQEWRSSAWPPVRYFLIL